MKLTSRPGRGDTTRAGRGRERDCKFSSAAAIEKENLSRSRRKRANLAINNKNNPIKFVWCRCLRDGIERNHPYSEVKSPRIFVADSRRQSATISDNR
uniref:Uncharacterized protein n=1 Tax=Romanomermis culicivorax TaxID=13658 RepID=A0A915HTP2_ROMCU